MMKSKGRHLYFHCFSGASGDMILGALLDLAMVENRLLEKELDKLGLEGFKISGKRVRRRGMEGTRLVVEEKEGVSPPLRTLHDLLNILEESSLKEEIKKKAGYIFTRLARAEGKVHGVSAERVHFHEIGALDTLVDVVGTLILLDQLQVEKVTSSPLHLGSGFIQVQHGTLPLPAPATLELLQGVPIYSRGVEGELVTPTGAVLITSLASSFGPLPPGRLLAAGYGAGQKELDHPNLLRVLLLQEEADREGGGGEGPEGNILRENILVLETNMDDMNPEMYPPLMEKLLQEGAWDVSLIPLHMKKNRPGVMLQVLCSPPLLGKMQEIIFRETSSLGLRVFKGDKYYLRRERVEVKTPLGKAFVKVGCLGEDEVNWAPEHQDCLEISRRTGRPLKEIYHLVEKAYWHQKKKGEE